MRFACQSCGKAYNLPEERIAEKSNVKLKCRVCGAIVEVKKHGEVVAQLLSETDGKRGTRVSEAPAPLASMSPDDPEDATAAIAIENHPLADERGFPFEEQALRPLPPPPATGFPMAPLPPPPARMDPAPGASHSEPPLAPPLPQPAGMDAGPSPMAPRVMPDLPGAPMLNAPMVGVSSLNGSNGASHGSLGQLSSGAHFSSTAPVADELPVPPVPNMAAMNVTPAPGSAAAVAFGAGAAEASNARVESDDTNKKMIAAFLTGIVVDRIISGLFF